MPLKARNGVHKEQIKAGTVGRLKGHSFEKKLSEWLNSLQISKELFEKSKSHIVVGHPAKELVRYICQHEQIGKISSVKACWLGGLATVRKIALVKNRKIEADWKEPVKKEKSKSDVLAEITYGDEHFIQRGISVKVCNNKTPTNDQLFCTGAASFCDLLISNGIQVSSKAREALKMFCGDKGFRPIDLLSNTQIKNRKSNPERFFWEELPEKGREELEKIFTQNQNQITSILLKKGSYTGDPYPPQYLIHQRTLYYDINKVPLAIFHIDELVEFSAMYSRFWKKKYRIKKGRFKNDPNIHEAPRFGFIQFQRLGNIQNATELQFNLKAGYFNKISELEKKLKTEGSKRYNLPSLLKWQSMQL